MEENMLSCWQWYILSTFEVIPNQRKQNVHDQMNCFVSNADEIGSFRFPQYNLPTFKVDQSGCLKKVRIGEEISLVRLAENYLLLIVFTH
jgi:hypothetical protein